MMDRTDRHFRWLMRQVTSGTMLYTEMITARALHHGSAAQLLAYDPVEHPLAVQLGGDEPELLAASARTARDLGYDEVNLNVGCPSPRVASGRFGAILMHEPGHVARCVEAMQAVVDIPVTVKHRIGVDDRDSYEDMLSFVDTVAGAGCQRFTVHARKAWLDGLSPKENRTIPPLRHGEVHRLKAERPRLFIETNGGITSWAEAQAHLQHVDAVMIGRWAYDDPWAFREADPLLGIPAPSTSRAEVARRYAAYIARQRRDGLTRTSAAGLARHALGLFTGVPGGRRWRRAITEGLQRESDIESVFERAIEDAPTA